MNVATISVDSIGRRVGAVQKAVSPTRWKRLVVFLKVAERCNIACEYCYFFFGGDESFEAHPPYIAADTIEQAALFLAKTVRESQVDELTIDFHGGEPMMLQKARFDDMCGTLRRHLGFVKSLSLGMQTNAMLVDDAWVDLIARHDISVGVSLDGPLDYNDEFRVDLKGRGTYKRTVAGMHLLSDAVASGRIKKGFGIICVADSRRDAKRTLAHFVDDLGVKDIFFALPMVSHDSMVPEEVGAFTKYLCDLFDAWVERDDAKLRIRFIDQMMGLLVGGSTGLAARERGRLESTFFTISSNGEIGGQDDERNAAPYAFSTGVMATGDIGLSDFYATPPLARYLKAKAERGTKCVTCCWGNVCNGGEELTGNLQRFSSERGFANHSVYCDALSALLVKMTQFALSKGVPFAAIQSVLVKEDGSPADESTKIDCELVCMDGAGAKAESAGQRNGQAAGAA